ncbi:ATP-binding protein [Derxia lacustris]|uniref:ATP-binding protein n=1 Tax=Derxia lacustris TaxID=764842 RepID=UPI001F46D259|nr:ATP-binding protein [Derxia lacustris]
MSPQLPPPERPPFSWRNVRRRLPRLAVAFACAALLAGAGRLGERLSEREALRASRIDADHRLDLFAAAVSAEIGRFQHVPATIQLNRDVLALLREPGSAERADTVNDYLRRLNAHVGGIAIYVMNERGVVLASSNSDAGDDSLVGAELAFRPYFVEALSGRVGRHFAIGERNGQPGYYVSHPVRDGARVVGVAAIKIGLRSIEDAWPMLGAPALIADGNEVVILSSQPEWRYTALTTLDIERRVDMQINRLYGERRIGSFPIGARLVVDADSERIDELLPNGGRALPRASDGLLVLGRRLDGMDWRLLSFTDLRGLRGQALVDGVLAAVAAGFVLLLGLIVVQRRRILKQRLEARLLLERANAELEQKVASRTRELTAANDRLRHEVAERIAAENTLRAAQDELVQAAKLAVLGQLATGITHELTQPLAAIRTLSGNAAEFLRRGNGEATAGNLEIIARMVEQMGSIIQPLKSFARKSEARPAAVDLAHAVGNALFILDARLREQRVEVLNRVPKGECFAWADQNRMEQVLVNLIANAADAMHEVAAPRIVIEAGQGADATAPHVFVSVTDTGAGLAPAVLGRLFEPFFTTKPVGAGLGLGLAISRDIAREAGGELVADNAPAGGARFTLVLPLPPETLPDA